MTVRVVAVLPAKEEVEPVLGVLKALGELKPERTQLWPANRRKQRLDGLLASRQVREAFGDEFSAGESVHVKAIVRRGAWICCQREPAPASPGLSSEKLRLRIHAREE